MHFVDARAIFCPSPERTTLLLPNPAYVLPSPRSRVWLPFLELARRASALTSGSSRLAFLRIELALQLYRDPTPQELWDRFYELHPAIAQRVYRPLLAKHRAQRLRAQTVGPAETASLAAEVSLPFEPDVLDREPGPSPAIRRVSTETLVHDKRHGRR